jgi:hypothetical protein
MMLLIKAMYQVAQYAQLHSQLIELRQALRTQAPNKRFQPTPLAASEIVAILAPGFCSAVSPFYRCGAAEAQGVGRQSISALRWILLARIKRIIAISLTHFSRGIGMSTLDMPTRDLLADTLQRFVVADADIIDIHSVTLSSGMSGSAVMRHTIQYTTTAGSASTSLITKDAERHEWRVLQHLQSQQQPNIPFAHSIDTSDNERLRICLQDVGDQNRPTSLDPISETELIREATGLAAIHTANFQQHRALDWVPSMSSAYIHDMLFVRAWRPAWETAIADARFAAAFRPTIPRIEAAAETIVADMQALLDEPLSQTLIHADLNPSNVLVYHGQPYFIDWQTAMRGPFYIDLPHHHCTLLQAEHYRQALATQGHKISRHDFAERYRVAARYIGFRYMWWTLEYWLSDPTQTPWVQHYIGLITGDGIGASHTTD